MRILKLSLILVCLTIPLSSVSAQPTPDNWVVTPNFPGLQNEEQIFLCRDDTSRVLINHRDFRLGYRQIGLGHGVEVVPGFWLWTDTLMSTDFQVFNRQSDPVMTVNSSGDYILCQLDYQNDSDTDSSHVAFIVSQDCGDTWLGPYTVSDTIGPYFEDKQFITCDRSGSIYDGNIYVSWTRFLNGLSTTEIELARSTTNGATWDDIVTVGPRFNVTCLGGEIYAGQFSQPLAGADGAVYVFWQGWDVDSTGGNCDIFPGIQMNKSTDGGLTWQGPRTLNRVDGYNFVDGSVDVYSQPTTAADLSGGPHAGNLYLQYRDTSSNGFFDSDIMFRRSLDTGHTWSPPIRVNDDPPDADVDQFHNWIVCNEEGVLVSIWYDQRDDPSHQTFTVYAGYSYDGGATWTTNHRISLDPIDPTLLAHVSGESPGELNSPASVQSPMAGKIAEYIGVDCVYDKIAATWTGTAAGPSGGTSQDVFAANWHLQVMTPRLIEPINGIPQSTDSIFLRWATSWKESDDQYHVQVASNTDFLLPILDVTVDSNTYLINTGLDQRMWYWRVSAQSIATAEGTGYSAIDSFYVELAECDCPHQGDFNADGFLDALDLNDLIDILFFAGANITDPLCTTTRADLNCDNTPDALDLNYLIEHLFFAGPVPCDPCNP